MGSRLGQRASIWACLVGFYVIPRRFEDDEAKFCLLWVDYFRRVFLLKEASRPRGYKTFSMLNLAEHDIFPAHKCFWHFNIYEQVK